MATTPLMATTLFKSVNILNCSGELPFLGDVLVQGNRIAGVYRGANPATVTLPENTQIIDGHSTATLMPGLIESHSHLSIDNTDDLAQIGVIPPRRRR